MKAIEQYFLVVLFIMLYKVVLTVESGDEILIRIKTMEHYSLWRYYSGVQLWGGLKVWVGEEILRCDHPRESYWEVLSSGAVYK